MNEMHSAFCLSSGNGFWNKNICHCLQFELFSLWQASWWVLGRQGAGHPLTFLLVCVIALNGLPFESVPTLHVRTQLRVWYSDVGWSVMDTQRPVYVPWSTECCHLTSLLSTRGLARRLRPSTPPWPRLALEPPTAPSCCNWLHSQVTHRWTKTSLRSAHSVCIPLLNCLTSPAAAAAGPSAAAAAAAATGTGVAYLMTTQCWPCSRLFLGLRGVRRFMYGIYVLYLFCLFIV